MMVKDPLQLPDNLPIPEDGGAADHLAGMVLPPVALRATDGTSVRLDELKGRTVVFAYPRTGRPGEPSLGGDEEWDAIPGAGGAIETVIYPIFPPNRSAEQALVRLAA